MIDLELADVVFWGSIVFILFAGGITNYAMGTRRQLVDLQSKLREVGIID